MRKVWQIWDEFWFAKQSLFNLAIFRIVLCTTMAFLYLSRQWDLTPYYTEAGILPKSLALAIYPDFYRPELLLAFWSDQWVPYLHLVLVGGLFCLALGIGGRLLTLVLWFLHLAFLQRNFSVAFGADLIGGIFLMLLIGTQSCERLSALSLGRPRRKMKEADIFSNAFYRLIQIQLLIIYFYTGIEKLKGSTWWDGTALWTVFANPQMVVVDMSWTRQVPLLLAGLTFSTILFEMYFPALIFGPLRKALLSVGLFFHLGIGAIMSLWAFAFIMLSPYILFLREEETIKLLSRLKMRFWRHN
jgi:hypothetical protein